MGGLKRWCGDLEIFLGRLITRSESKRILQKLKKSEPRVAWRRGTGRGKESKKLLGRSERHPDGLMML